MKSWPLALGVWLLLASAAGAQEPACHAGKPLSSNGGPADGIQIRNLKPDCPCCCRMCPTPRNGVWAVGWAAKGDEASLLQEEHYLLPRPEPLAPRWGFPFIPTVPTWKAGGEVGVVVMPSLDFIDAGYGVDLPLAGSEVPIDRLDLGTLSQVGFIVEFGWFTLRVSYGDARVEMNATVERTMPTPLTTNIEIDGSMSLLLVDLQRSFYELRAGALRVSAYGALGIARFDFESDSGTEADAAGVLPTAALDLDAKSWTGPHAAVGVDAFLRIAGPWTLRLQLESGCAKAGGAFIGGVGLCCTLGFNF